MPAPRATRGTPRWRVGLIWGLGPTLVVFGEDCLNRRAEERHR